MVLEVLVVDDEYADSICKYMKADFLNYSINFHSTFSGEKAVKKIKENSYDLIILDYNLPEENGYQIAKKLKSLRKNIKIIGFSTGWNEVEAKEAGLVLYSCTKMPIINYIHKLLEK